MSTISKPSPGTKFRLRNVASGRYIFNNNKSSKSDNFGAFAGPEHSDQLWTLIPGTGEREGWFQLQNAETGKCMFYNHARKNDFHIHPAGDFPDQFWKMEPGVGALKRCFRLVNMAGNTTIFANVDGRFTGWDKEAKHTDQYWEFVFENPEDDNRYYDSRSPSPPATRSGFPFWKLYFDADGNPTPHTNSESRVVTNTVAVEEDIIEYYNKGDSSNRHIFIALHGVAASADVYEGYADTLAEIFDEYQLEQAGVAKKSDISFIGINWQSQEMMQMLTSLVNIEDLVGAREKMPALKLAEAGLFELVSRLCAIRGPHAPKIHLIGHSMGTQALLYVLPKLYHGAELGSMFLIQGFAPQSAFLETSNVNSIIGSAISITPLNAPEVIKVSDFSKHINKVKGPIVATTTIESYDWQIALAKKSVYHWSGAIGMDGFGSSRSDSTSITVHDLLDSEAEGGQQSYDFDQGKKFFTLSCFPYITDHDDFRNRAVAFAHLQAARVISRDDIPKIRQKRYVAPEVPSLTPDRWMGESWATIGSRTLTGVCLPGSHDAGTGVIESVVPSEAEIPALVREKLSFLKNIPEKYRHYLDDPIKRMYGGSGKLLLTRLTQTHNSPIESQLREGARYFDMRPAWTHNSAYSLAHVTKLDNDDPKSKWIGGVGEKLAAALADIKAFASQPEHARELIILNFSHDADLVDGGSLSEERKGEVVAMIRETLGTSMIVSDQPDVRLDRLPLSKLVEGGRTVLCVFDGFPGQISVKDGVFSSGPIDEDGENSYWGKPPVRRPQPHFPLFDKYSESRNQAVVIGGQKRKYKDFMATRAQGQRDGVFLLSWTATLGISPALLDGKTIINHALELNSRLLPSMQNWIQRGQIRDKARPNILYVDSLDREALHIAALINALPLGE